MKRFEQWRNKVTRTTSAAMRKHYAPPTLTGGAFFIVPVVPVNIGIVPFEFAKNLEIG